MEAARREDGALEPLPRRRVGAGGRRELRPDLGADEVMLWELEGLRVHLTADAAVPKVLQSAPEEFVDNGIGRFAGTVVGVIPREELTGNPDLGNDLLRIELAVEGSDEDPESRPPGPTVLVPYVPQIAVEVRVADGLLLLDPPPGLFDFCVEPPKRERVVIRGLLPERAASLL